MQQRARTPFSRTASLERLTVVVDSALIDGLGDQQSFSPELLLGGLLSHDLIRCLRYADEGPPAHLPRESDFAPNAVHGWVVVTGYEADIHSWSLVADDGKTIKQTAFGGDFPRAAEGDTRTPAYGDLEVNVAAARRRDDVVAAQAAAASSADIFISTRPYLFAVGWDVAYGLLVATPAQALPLVSLYLRAQGEFIDWRSLDGTGTSSMNRGLFYQRSVVSLVPSIFGALVGVGAHARAGGDPRVLQLTEAVFGRLQQTLVARDSMYWALNQPQNSDTAFEALTAFDLALLTLMGAADALARLTHRLLGLSGSDHSAAWQRDTWREQLAEACPDIVVALEQDERLAAVTLLKELRNTIHAGRLDPVAVTAGQLHLATRFELPADRAEQTLAAIDRLGGRDAWGIESHAPDRHHAAPAQLLDGLIVRLTPMINGVLAALSDARLPVETLEPPTRFWGFADNPARTYLWQLDLAADVAA
jgi:hypothetical protein